MQFIIFLPFYTFFFHGSVGYSILNSRFKQTKSYNMVRVYLIFVKKNRNVLIDRLQMQTVDSFLILLYFIMYKYICSSSFLWDFFYKIPTVLVFFLARTKKKIRVKCIRIQFNSSQEHSVSWNSICEHSYGHLLFVLFCILYPIKSLNK